jgi:hypothetical protein
MIKKTPFPLGEAAFFVPDFHAWRCPRAPFSVMIGG